MIGNCLGEFSDPQILSKERPGIFQESLLGSGLTWRTCRWESTETRTRVGMKCSSGAHVSENHSWGTTGF